MIALTRLQERSWLVWLALLPGALVLYLLVGEFRFPHDHWVIPARVNTLTTVF